MFDIEEIINYDKQLLLTLNGSDSLFWDGVMYVYTSTWVWMPLAVIFLYLLVKNNNMRTFFLLLGIIALLFFCTDGIASGICKPLFARFRPTNDPDIMYMVKTVDDYRGGSYGFMSSHAANSFGIATFAIWLIRNKILSISLIIWALMTGYTRIYLGVHYPGDVLCGTIVGIIVGTIIYSLFNKLRKGIKSRRGTWVSDYYTKTGYAVSDVQLLLMVLYATFAFIPILAFIFLKVKLV